MGREVGKSEKGGRDRPGRNFALSPRLDGHGHAFSSRIPTGRKSGVDFSNDFRSPKIGGARHNFVLGSLPGLPQLSVHGSGLRRHARMSQDAYKPPLPCRRSSGGVSCLWRRPHASWRVMGGFGQSRPRVQARRRGSWGLPGANSVGVAIAPMSRSYARKNIGSRFAH